METQKGFEVIRFIEHGSLTRVAMDYMKGKLLWQRLKEKREVEKEQIFAWMHMLANQLALFHRCRKKPCYRYLSPESVMIAEDGCLYLLDLEAESNAFVLMDMQRREMRQHFIKKELYFRENMRLETDLFCLGKTMQFMLAYAKVEPKLTRLEERKLEHVILKCLGNNSCKIYQSPEQILKELPKYHGKNTEKKGKRLRWVCIVLVIGTVVTGVFCCTRSQLEADITLGETSWSMDEGESNPLPK